MIKKGFVVIGIGNPMRTDDRIGIEIVNEMRIQPYENVDYKIEQGNIAALIEILGEYQFVFIVDAMRVVNAEVGELITLDVTDKPLACERLQSSSHILDISQSIELARALGQFPRKLLIFAISAHNFEFSDSLSPPMQQQFPQLLSQIKNKIQSHLLEGVSDA